MRIMFEHLENYMLTENVYTKYKQVARKMYVIQKKTYEDDLVEMIPELREKRRLFYTGRASGLGAQWHGCRMY